MHGSRIDRDPRGGKRGIGKGALRREFAIQRNRRQFAARPPRRRVETGFDNRGRARERDEIDLPSGLFDQRDDALRKIGGDARLGMEGEDQRAFLRRSRAEHVEPHRLAQSDEGIAAKGKNRQQRIDDQMVVEQRQPGLRREFARDGQLARCRWTMDEDQPHPPHARNSIRVRSCAWVALAS